jgi:CHASE2 domain-containing sensor protein
MTEAVGQHASASTSRPFLLALGAGWAILVALGLVVMSQFGALPEGPDEWTYDWRTFLFSPAAEEPRKDIAVILIDEESLADYDYVSPVDRGLVAGLLQAVDAAHPRAIGLDFIYDRKSEEAKTNALIAAIKGLQAPMTFGAIDLRVRGFREEGLGYQENFIARTGHQAGHVFFARQQESLKIGDQVVRYLGEPSPAPPGRKSLVRVLAEVAGVPTTEPSTSYIAWMRPPAGDDLFPLFKVPRHKPGDSIEKILPASWRPALKDRIVLIGGDFIDRDKHLTPLSVWDGAKMPGVLVQAQILAQLIDGRAISEVPPLKEFVMLAIVGFLGFLVTSHWLSKRFDWVLYFSGIGVLIVAGAILFSKYGLLIPSTTLFFAWTLGVTGGHYVPEALKRFRLRFAT